MRVNRLKWKNQREINLVKVCETKRNEKGKKSVKCKITCSDSFYAFVFHSFECRAPREEEKRKFWMKNGIDCMSKTPNLHPNGYIHLRFIENVYNAIDNKRSKEKGRKNCEINWTFWLQQPSFDSMTNFLRIHFDSVNSLRDFTTECTIVNI